MFGALTLALGTALIGPADGADVAALVNPFIGTTTQAGAPFGAGDTFPGAASPSGMVQWSPDTPANPPGGYEYADTAITGFSLTHFSGRGCQAWQDFPFLPVVGPVTDSPGTRWRHYAAAFSHANETAQPGFYGVRLDPSGTQVSLTVTPRTGMGRFVFPRSPQATILINAGGSINGDKADGTGLAILGDREVTGSAHSTVGCGSETYTLYFVAQFDRPCAAFGTWGGDTVSPNARRATGAHSGAFLTFDAAAHPAVQVKVGLSFVSLANARANLAAENPGWDFDAARRAARASWNAVLGRIEVRGGTTAAKTVFYTALYHSLLHPNVFSDADGDYLGMDGQVHRVAPGHAQYENIPCWDEYRCLAQLRALLAPRETSDILQTLVNDAQQGGGGLPRWEQANRNSNGMVGDHGDAYIAGAYAFGARGFDVGAALTAMDKGASQPGTRSDGHSVRAGLTEYLAHGYLPGSAAETLDLAVDDFAVSQFAASLGMTDLAQRYQRRAQDWRNLYNPATGYVEPRPADGTWPVDFQPTSGRGFVEGDSAQYTWMVPFNLAGLFDAMGGPAQVIPRLDAHFTRLNGGTNSPYCFMGNEPEFEVPWEYDFAGAPWKTQAVARRIQTTLFTDAPGGLPGNDDGGAMSSWYVFSVLGMYPEIPGVGDLVLGSPAFAHVTIHLENGRRIQVNGDGAAPDSPYVQSLALNGHPTTHVWLPYASIERGGTLTFRLGPQPNPAWGSQAAAAPPSFGDPTERK